MFKHLPDIMSFKEAREYLRLGKNSMLDLLHSGQIQGFKIGSKWKITKEAMIDYLKGL